MPPSEGAPTRIAHRWFASWGGPKECPIDSSFARVSGLNAKRSMLVRSGMVLVKYWFSISDAEQHRRFQMRIRDPLKQWKLSPMDLESRRRWELYTNLGYRWRSNGGPANLLGYGEVTYGLGAIVTLPVWHDRIDLSGELVGLDVVAIFAHCVIAEIFAIPEFVDICLLAFGEPVVIFRG